jgi:hypothetical protein
MSVAPNIPIGDRMSKKPPTRNEEPLPSANLVWTTCFVVVVAAVAGALIFIATDPQLHLDPQGFAVFAPIYVAAQAIERLLEPIAARYKTAEPEKKELKAAREELALEQQKLTAALAADVGVEKATADVKKATEDETINANKLERKRRERGLVFFLIASVTACLLAGVFGLGIYEAMSTQTLEDYLGAIDVALTGLVIGAGTKPLHDLITRIEKAKENADPSDKPAVPAPATPVTATPPAGP